MLTVCWDDPNFVSTLLVTIFQKCQSADNPIYSVNLRDYTLAIAAAFSLAEPLPQLIEFEYGIN